MDCSVIQVYLIITLSLGSIKTDSVISETVLYVINMSFEWSFPYFEVFPVIQVLLVNIGTKFLWLVVAIFVLEHDVEAIFHLS